MQRNIGVPGLLFELHLKMNVKIHNLSDIIIAFKKPLLCVINCTSLTFFFIKM